MSEYTYDPCEDDENDGPNDIQYSSKIIDFKKIKAIKFGDPIIKGKIKFKSWIDFYKFDSVIEASFEADYGLAYLLYKYSAKFDIIPRYITIGDGVIRENFFDNFRNEMDIPDESYNFSHIYDNKNVDINYFYIYMERMIFYSDGYTSYLIYPPEFLKDKESSLYIFLGIIKAYKNPQVSKNKIYVVHKTSQGFQKKAFSIKKRNIDLQENYNDDFEEISKEIILKLNNKKKTGLVILHGAPGTGKTTFIRYLAGKLKRDIIFISPDMVYHITTPEFIPFLLNNSNSILIIEDAEPALQKRLNGKQSGAISNILNMTDGLLSDCLNISIVATFNTSTKDIDEALLRKGRLLKSYKFEKLEVSKAQSLMNKIYKNIKIKEPMSLAEIYFYEDENQGDDFSHKKTGFGN